MTAHYLQITATHDMGGGNTAVNVFKVHGTALGSWTGANTVTVANAAIARLKTFYDWATGAGVATPWTIGATVLEYKGDPIPLYVQATPLVSNSFGTFVALPPQLAAVISWRTGEAGRRKRGRTYLGPLTTTAVTGAALNGTFADQVTQRANTIVGTPVAAGFAFCVHSPTADDTTTITSGFCDTQVDTLRSRVR